MDKDKCITNLRDLIKPSNTNDENEALLFAIESVRELGKAQNDKWTPIKTREMTEEEKEDYPDSDFMYDCKMPDDGEDVLVTTWGGSVALDTFCRDNGCYFETYCDDGDVIAWQPLPKPYEKGGAE